MVKVYPHTIGGAWAPPPARPFWRENIHGELPLEYLEIWCRHREELNLNARRQAPREPFDVLSAVSHHLTIPPAVKGRSHP